MKKTVFATAAFAAIVGSTWLMKPETQAAEDHSPRWANRAEFVIGIEHFKSNRWRFLEVYTAECAAVQPLYTYTDAALVHFYGKQYIEQENGYSVFPVHKWAGTFGVWSPECGWLMTERPVSEIKPLPTGRRRRSARD